MLKLLVRTLCLTFYQQHVGLFLVAFYLLFGMIQGYALVDFHLALLVSICSSPLNFLTLLAVWFLYAVKCVFFVKQKLALPSYQFTSIVTSMPSKRQYVVWTKLYGLMLLPILAYAVLMLMVSVKHQFYLTFLVTIIGVVLIILLLVGYTYRFSNFEFKVSKIGVNLPSIKVNKPFWSWPLYHLLKEQWVMLLVCKVVSIVSFKLILLVFADVGNDIRVSLTALFAVVLSHAILVFNLIKFDAFYLAFAKNLPINAFSRLMGWGLVFLLLLTPEFGLLFWLSSLTVLQLANCLFFCMAMMLVLQMLVYLLKADMESYMKCLLFFFFVGMLAILSSYYLIFSLLLIPLAVATFFWRYNTLDLKELA